MDHFVSVSPCVRSDGPPSPEPGGTLRLVERKESWLGLRLSLNLRFGFGSSNLEKCVCVQSGLFVFYPGFLRESPSGVCMCDQQQTDIPVPREAKTDQMSENSANCKYSSTLFSGKGLGDKFGPLAMHACNSIKEPYTYLVLTRA